MAITSKLPPPEQRLCKIHNRPITPHAWRTRHRATGCSKCENERGVRNFQQQKHWGRKAYRRIMNRVEQDPLARELRGFELFQRITGFQL